MNTDDLVSVIIPAYNHEKYIKEAIQSVIDQTYKNIELLIIDDGSSDETWSKINEMRTVCEERFLRVVFETQENKGTCLTINKLLHLSEGEYIQLLASDDKLAHESIKILHEFLSKNLDYALAVGRNELIDANSVICYWDANGNNVYDKEKAKYKSFTDSLNQVINLNSEDFGTYEMLLRVNHIPNGYLIRKSIFDKTGYFTTKAPLEDYWLMLQIAKYAKMKFIDVTTFYYRWHGANTASQKEKMIMLTEKTINYEIEQVEKSNNKVLKKYTDTHIKKKIYFKIPFILEVFRVKLMGKRQIILKVFKHRYVLADK